MHGEHLRSLLKIMGCPGLSPYARGTLKEFNAREHVSRFIPVCTGNTNDQDRSSGIDAVYPRMHGEHCTGSMHRCSGRGLSPYARGTPDSKQDNLFGIAVYPRMHGEHYGMLAGHSI